MPGKRSGQQHLLDADSMFLDFVGRDTLYGSVALNRDRLFSDEQFASLYCPDNARRSVPPSLPAVAPLKAHQGGALAVFVSSGLRWTGGKWR